MNIILKNTDNEKSANWYVEIEGLICGEISSAIYAHQSIEDLVEGRLPVGLGIPSDEVPIKLSQEQILTALSNIEQRGDHKGPGSLYRALKKIQIKGIQSTV